MKILQTCKKCGNGDGNAVSYDRVQDKLRISCSKCGYTWISDPLDKMSALSVDDSETVLLTEG